MRVVISTCYGGFGYSDAFLEAYPEAEEMERDSAELIAALEEFGLEAASGDCAELTIVDLPAETTDYELTEYDGLEGVTYVVDGQLYHA